MILLDKYMAAGRGVLPLDSAAKGSRLVIVEIPPGRSRMQLIRLGILEGEAVRVIERMPGGTVVIEKNRREIAIGAVLARTLLVAPIRFDHA
jgi:Fe2+ transport system protein FeoA